jgi:hypothetical protein
MKMEIYPDNSDGNRSLGVGISISGRITRIAGSVLSGDLYVGLGWRGDVSGGPAARTHPVRSVRDVLQRGGRQGSSLSSLAPRKAVFLASAYDSMSARCVSRACGGSPPSECRKPQLARSTSLTLRVSVLTVRRGSLAPLSAWPQVFVFTNHLANASGERARRAVRSSSAPLIHSLKGARHDFPSPSPELHGKSPPPARKKSRSTRSSRITNYNNRADQLRRPCDLRAQGHEATWVHSSLRRERWAERAGTAQRRGQTDRPPRCRPDRDSRQAHAVDRCDRNESPRWRWRRLGGSGLACWFDRQARRQQRLERLADLQYAGCFECFGC